MEGLINLLNSGKFPEALQRTETGSILQINLLDIAYEVWAFFVSSSLSYPLFFSNIYSIMYFDIFWMQNSFLNIEFNLMNIIPGVPVSKLNHIFEFLLFFRASISSSISLPFVFSFIKSFDYSYLSSSSSYFYDYT